MDEWDYTRNGKPSGYEPNSIVWWICVKDPTHRWKARVVDRAHGSTCPYCKEKKVHSDTSIATLYPSIAAEWYYPKNSRLGHPSTTPPHATKKVWWKCKRGACDCHVWKASVIDRINGKGCTYCSGIDACEHSNLTLTHPGLVAEWDYENNIIRPQDVARQSTKQVYWKCNKRSCDCHRWKASPKQRTGRGKDCMYCKKIRLCVHDSLCATHSDIAETWDYSKNRTFPSEVHSDSKKKIWWTCGVENHTWEESVKDRVINASCPYC